MIQETAARGYAIRSDGEFNSKTSSIAVPIVRDELVLGCISIIWISTALKVEEAVSQFAAPMQEAASKIPFVS